MLKKGMVVGVIFLLMLVSIPMVSGEHIFYPKEEGPYTVTAMGPSNGGGGRLFTLFHLLPLWFLLYPLDVDWHFDSGSVFFVNGEKQDIVYPAHIGLYGFKGYGQTVYMLILKGFAAAFICSLTGVLPTTRARVIGLCTEIIVDDSR
jgi:hypothetical protein